MSAEWWHVGLWIEPTHGQPVRPDTEHVTRRGTVEATCEVCGFALAQRDDHRTIPEPVSPASDERND